MEFADERKQNNAKVTINIHIYDSWSLSDNVDDNNPTVIRLLDAALAWNAAKSLGPGLQIVAQNAYERFIA